MRGTVKKITELDFLEDGYGEFLSIANGVNLAIQYVLVRNFEGRLTPEDLFSLCSLLDVLEEKLDNLNQQTFETAEKLMLKEVA